MDSLAQLEKSWMDLSDLERRALKVLAREFLETGNQRLSFWALTTKWPGISDQVYRKLEREGWIDLGGGEARFLDPEYLEFVKTKL